MNLISSSETSRKQSLLLQDRRNQEHLAKLLLEKQKRRRAQGEKSDLLSWSILRRARLKPGVSFDLITHRYLRDIYKTNAKVVVVYKASQMGASEYAISYSLHAADERGATVLYVFPTDTHVSDFSSARIGPAIEASPYLNRIVVEGGGGKTSEDNVRQRGADRVTLKRVGDRFVYLRGSQVNPRGLAPQLKSVDADVLILDEVDEMDPRAPTIAVKRLGHSTIAEERWISTPTYANVGIHAKWQETDQREWFVRCDHCGECQPLSIHNLVVEWDSLDRPAAWNQRNDGQPFIACRKCKQGVDRLMAGRWVATFPDRDIVGFHLTRFFSPTASLMEMLAALSTTDETKRKEAYNQDLGEPYTPHGGNLNDEVLDDCRREYGHGPKESEETFAGVDVGKVLHVVVRGQLDLETGERPQRFAGEIESFEELGRLIKRYNVRRAVIDALPETRKARELQASFLGIVWLAYYVTQKTGTKRSDPEDWDTSNGVVNLDRTRTLDRTFGRFYDGKNTLPGNIRSIGDYYAQMKSPVRVLEDGPGGEKVAQYVETGPDHYAHAENYCEAAAANPSFAIIDFYRRKASQQRLEENADADNSTPD